MRTCLLSLVLAATALAESRVTVVTIEDEIGPSTVYLVKRSLEQARANHSELVLFEINTPGGRVDSALDIANLIDKAGVPTAAWVRSGNFGGAQSAGALISISCGRILMDSTATIGSAQPVTSDGIMASEKIISWVSATFRAWAEKKKFPPLVAMGMVDPDLEIHDIEIAGDPATIGREAGASPERRLVDASGLSVLEKQGAKFKVVRDIKLKGKLLNLTAREARDLGISSDTVDSREAAFTSLGVKPSEIVLIGRSWSESFVGFITQSGVTGILISLGFIFVWVEMKTPGIGVPAILAATCFGLVFFGHYLVGLAGATEIILFLIGAVLLLVEVFTPGFGFVGISGILLILASLVLALQNFVIPTNPYQWNSLTGNFLMLTASTGFAVLGFAALVKFLPSTPMFSRIILNSELAPAEAPREAVLVGRTGIAFTDLRPSGKAEIDGMTIDVVAEGEFVEKSSPVTVVRVEGPSIVVRRS